MKEEQGGAGATINRCGVAYITQEPKALTSAPEVVQYDDQA